MSTERTPDPGKANPPVPSEGKAVAEADGNGMRRRRRIAAGVGFLALLGLGTLAYWLLFLRGYVFTDDARIGGHLVDLSPEVSGTLVEVACDEGQYVHKGEVVFRLNPAIPSAALAQARAALVAARADVASNEALYQKSLNGNRPEQVRAAEATHGALKTQEDLARIDFERSRRLFAATTISQDELDRARTAYEAARQNRENAEQNMLLMQRGTRAEDLAAAKAALDLSRSRVEAAEAALASAEATLARYAVRAPFDGWVVRRWLQPGAMPLPAQPVVSLFDPSTLRVDANIEEKDLGGVAVGDLADVTVDAYPGLRLEGRVTRIMRAVNSEFSLIPSEGVAGTFIKVTQRVPIRISVSPPSGYTLGPGLSVEVRIHSGSAGAGPARPPAHD